MRIAAIGLVCSFAVAGLARADDKKAAELAAKVFEQSEKAKAVRIVMKFTDQAKIEGEMTSWYRNGFGARLESRDQKTGEILKIAIGDVKKEKLLLLDVQSMTATVRAFTEQKLDREGILPARVRSTTNITRAADEKIDGRVVHVLEGVAMGVTGGVWALWVDPKTSLPVRLRMEKPGPNDKLLAMEMTFHDWDKEFDARMFSAEMPKGYVEAKK